MFRFASPYFFFLALPLAVAAWAVYRRRVSAGILFAPLHRISRTAPTWRAVVGNTLPAFALAGLLLVIVALARPQTVISKTHRTADVIAIEMVVDISGSMQALDMSERMATGWKYRTRLDAVKETFQEFIARRPDDLIGLVTFGGYAATRAPLTTDHEALTHVLKGVEIPRQAFDSNGNIVNQEELMTAIGDALATAVARLEKAEPKSRIIVLLSDGESNTGIIQPEDAIKAATKLGVRAYTIGVGSTGEAPFRVRDAFGREQIMNQQVTLDENLLRRIASATDGKYYNVRDPKGLENAMQSINELEKTRIERDIYQQYHELFPWLLLPALALIVLGTGLNMMVTRRVL